MEWLLLLLALVVTAITYIFIRDQRRQQEEAEARLEDEFHRTFRHQAAHRAEVQAQAAKEQKVLSSMKGSSKPSMVMKTTRVSRGEGSSEVVQTTVEMEMDMGGFSFPSDGLDTSGMSSFPFGGSDSSSPPPAYDSKPPSSPTSDSSYTAPSASDSSYSAPSTSDSSSSYTAPSYDSTPSYSSSDSSGGYSGGGGSSSDW